MTEEKFERGNEDSCPDCKGEGMIVEKDGQCHTCWRCLREGKLDVHSKKIPDTNLRL